MKPVFVFTLGLLVALIAVLIYGWLDRSITADHSRRELQYEQTKAKILRELLRETTRDWKRENIKRLIAAALKQEQLVKESRDKIEIDGIIFAFSDDNLTRISFSNESNN